MTTTASDDPTAQRIAALWRRQLVLVAVAAVLIVGCLALVAAAGLSGGRTSAASFRAGPGGEAVEVARPPDSGARLMLWPAVIGAIGAIALLAAVLAHTIRVASFTFRRSQGE